MLWGTFYWHTLGVVISLDGKVNDNRYLMVLSDCHHPMLQHFLPARRGVFQNGNDHHLSPTPLYRARVVAQWFDEHDTDVIQTSWPSQSQDLNPLKHLWYILEQCLRQRFPPPSSRCKFIDFLMEEWCHIPHAEFQTLVDSMPWYIQAVLATYGGPTPYSVTLHWCLHFLCPLPVCTVYINCCVQVFHWHPKNLQIQTENRLNSKKKSVWQKAGRTYFRMKRQCKVNFPCQN